MIEESLNIRIVYIDNYLSSSLAVCAKVPGYLLALSASNICHFGLEERSLLSDLSMLNLRDAFHHQNRIGS